MPLIYVWNSRGISNAVYRFTYSYSIFIELSNITWWTKGSKVKRVKQEWLSNLFYFCPQWLDDDKLQLPKPSCRARGDLWHLCHGLAAWSAANTMERLSTGARPSNLQMMHLLPPHPPAFTPTPSYHCFHPPTWNHTTIVASSLGNWPFKSEEAC